MPPFLYCIISAFAFKKLLFQSSGFFSTARMPRSCAALPKVACLWLLLRSIIFALSKAVRSRLASYPSTLQASKAERCGVLPSMVRPKGFADAVRALVPLCAILHLCHGKAPVNSNSPDCRLFRAAAREEAAKTVSSPPAEYRRRQTGRAN